MDLIKTRRQDFCKGFFGTIKINHDMVGLLKKDADEMAVQ
jgi:hypothetical protein